MKPEVREVIVVEGRYDKNAVLQCVNATVLETEGFGLFSNREKQKLLRTLAEKRGLVVLTDSDGAGFVIRNFLKGAVDPGLVRHAYIPQIAGKERRKRIASREGTLGVEGMKPEVILEALRRCGALREESGESARENAPLVTKSDLYELGLSGGKDSAALRIRLQRSLDLPEQLSSNAFLDVINALYTREEFISLCLQALPKEPH